MPLMCLSACAHFGVTKYTGEAYAPTQEIEVFHAFPTDRAYKEIAKLSIRQRRKSEARLIEEAKKLGADGIIFMSPVSRGRGYFPSGGSAIGINMMDVSAIAIKWK